MLPYAPAMGNGEAQLNWRRLRERLIEAREELRSSLESSNLAFPEDLTQAALAKLLRSVGREYPDPLLLLLLKIARLIAELRAALLPPSHHDAGHDRAPCGRIRLAAPQVPRAPGTFPSLLTRREWDGSKACLSGEAQAA